MDNVQLLSEIAALENEYKADSEILIEAIFFKIFVKFEQYLSSVFIGYCTGKSSSRSYTPVRKLEFIDVEHFNSVIQKSDRDYTDNIRTIIKLSRHIFLKDPFVGIYEAQYASFIDEMVSIRNHVAHESESSKNKYVAACLGGSSYLSPGKYLLKKRRRVRKTNYQVYIEKIKEVSELILYPPTT